MQRRNLLLSFCVALGFLVLGGDPASAQVDTRRFCLFGDSLSNNPFLHVIFDTDPEIYGQVPYLGMFEKAAPAEDQFVNFSAPGETSPDVLDQVTFYAASEANGMIDSATLVSIQGGGNDILDAVNLFTLASAPPGVHPGADAIVEEIRQNLTKSLQLLYSRGQPQVILSTVPDVTLTPFVFSLFLSETQASNVSQHIARLNRFIRMQANRRNVVVLDIDRVLLETSLNPPTFQGTQLIPPPAFGFSTAIFADPIHPTAVSNAILANDLIDQLNKKFDDEIPYFSEAELATLAIEGLPVVP